MLVQPACHEVSSGGCSSKPGAQGFRSWGSPFWLMPPDFPEFNFVPGASWELLVCLAEAFNNNSLHLSAEYNSLDLNFETDPWIPSFFRTRAGFPVTISMSKCLNVSGERADVLGYVFARNQLEPNKFTKLLNDNWKTTRREMWTHCHICQCSLRLARLGSAATLRVLASGSGQTLPSSRKKLMVSHMWDAPFWHEVSNDSHECICFQTCNHDTRDDVENHITIFFILSEINKEF